MMQKLFSRILLTLTLVEFSAPETGIWFKIKLTSILVVQSDKVLECVYIS